MRNSLLALLALFFVTHAHAAVIEKPLANAAQEEQAREMFHALRCVVCEGQSLAESDAVLAVQMRGRIRAMLAQGRTSDEIYEAFRRSYGDRILMKPPFDGSTFLLWMAPALLLVLGGGLIWRMTRVKEGNE